MFSLRYLIIFIALAAPSIYAKKKVVCYFAAWSAGRSGDGRFTVLDADTDHCTHVVYAFMTLNENTSHIMSVDPYIDTSKNGIGENSLVRLSQLKLTNPDVKVMVSIGGWIQGSTRFSNVAKDPTKRLVFINSVLHFLKKYELDGLDICWQFPTQRGGVKEDKENSVTLFREIKQAFKRDDYILSLHIIAKRYVIDSYNVKEVSDIVDFINLVAVEYNGPWDRRTGIMAPLISKDANNVQFNVDYMIKKGAARKKLLLGMPTYGHAYLLKKAPTDNNELLGQYTEQTFASPWTTEGGIISYVEFCVDVNRTSGWTQVWDDASQTPIAYNDIRFVTLDNRKSLLKKAELVSSRSLGGVAFWSLDMDDFRGLCHGIKYPLVSAVAEYLNQIGVAEKVNEQVTPEVPDQVTEQVTTQPERVTSHRYPTTTDRPQVQVSSENKEEGLGNRGEVEANENGVELITTTTTTTSHYPHFPLEFGNLKPATTTEKSTSAKPTGSTQEKFGVPTHFIWQWPADN